MISKIAIWYRAIRESEYDETLVRFVYLKSILRISFTIM